MDLLHTPLEAASMFAMAAHNVTSNTLNEYTRPTRLEPIALVDKSLLASISPEQMVALEQTMLSVYSGLYLTAISLSMKVGDVIPIQMLGQFATNRSLSLAAGNSVYWAFENLRDHMTSDYVSLPTSEELSNQLNDTINKASLGLEEFQIDGDPFNYRVTNDPSAKGLHLSTLVNNNEVKQNIDVDKTIHNIVDESNLVVGKILNIPLSYGDKNITIQTTVTLRPKSLNSDDIVTICRHNSRDLSWSARWHAMRSGEITFCKDWLLNQDLIEEYRRGLYSDKTGVLMNLKSSRSKNIWAAIISGRASPNAISAMMFVSKDTANKIQQATGLKLDNFHDREQLFEGTSSAWLIVVDPIREAFVIYSRGIEDRVDSTFVHIKGNAKNPKGVDINQVLEAYKLGNVSTMLN